MPPGNKLRAPAPWPEARAPAADWQPGSAPPRGARSAAGRRCAPRDRGRAPAAAGRRCPAGERKQSGSGTGARSARGLAERGREGEPWQEWRTTPPLRPGEASAAQGSRNAVERLASALARCASWGRPGGVIARPQGRLPIRFLGDQPTEGIGWWRLHQGGFGMGWRCCCEGL